MSTVEAPASHLPLPMQNILSRLAANSTEAEQALVRKAYAYAAAAHAGQVRLSGEPYLSHPLAVAEVLAELGFDAHSVAAGLLHDTVEDSKVTLEEVDAEFGEQVADIVDGVTKISMMTFDSKEELFKERVVSDFDRQTAQNSLLEAEASLAQAKANETNARNDLSYTVVRSPVDGVAGMSSYRVGTLVNSSITTPLLTVSDDEEVYVYFSMTENQMLSLLRQYGSVDKSLAGMPKVSLQLSDGVKYAHEGVIDAISGTIDTGTGAVSLRAVFPNPEGMLRNGSTATLVLPYTKENALVVPQEATFEIQDKVYVYKVNESGKAESAQVTVFPLNNGQEYIVESGLQEGEVIVAEGAGLIQENTQILSLHTEK